MTMKTTLHLGIDQGEYWVENSFSGFFFNGRYQSREALRSAILTRRNDYYRAFPLKTFRISLMTDDADFKDLVEEINNTPYERDE